MVDWERRRDLGKLVNANWRRYASPHTGMKTDLNGEILVGSAEAI
ncbi:MAG: hypothetical protein ABSF45_31420 [Terriglobia bacterium]